MMLEAGKYLYDIRRAIFLIMFATVMVSAEDAPVEREMDAGQVETAGENPVVAESGGQEAGNGKQEAENPEPQSKAPEKFNPTDEVSKDYSTEFPVDI